MYEQFLRISYGTNHVVEVFKELNATPEKIYKLEEGQKTLFGLKQHLMLVD